MSSDTFALIGREKEIEVVRRFLAEAEVDGRGLLLTGPPEVGSAAAAAATAATAASAGALVIRATGVAAKARLPFAGVSQLLAPFDGAVERLAPGHRAVLSAALGQGEGRNGVRDDGAGRLVDGDAVAVALVSALELVAGARPVVLAVDDLPTMDL